MAVMIALFWVVLGLCESVIFIVWRLSHMFIVWRLSHMFG